MKKYVVSQTFSIFGNPANRVFKTKSAAEKYADELAHEIALCIAENNAKLTDEDSHDGTGMSNEVEWERENWRNTNVDNLKSSIMRNAIEIEEIEK